MLPKRIERLTKGDEVARNEPRSLMDHLIERVLAVGSRLTEVDRTSVIGHRSAIQRDLFAVALHGQQLQIGRESLQVLLVRQNGNSLCAEKVVVPDAQEAHQDRQIGFEGSSSEMLIHLVKSIQHGVEVLWADGSHRGEADSRLHGVASA